MVLQKTSLMPEMLSTILLLPLVMSKTVKEASLQKRAEMPKEELPEEQKDVILKKCTILSCRKWVEVEVHEENVRCRGESCRSATCDHCVCTCKPNYDDCGKKFQVCESEDD